MTTFSSESPSTETHSAPRLHRSATDRLCCGVCGGIAEYLSVDSSLVRFAFIVGTLWGGIGLLLYIVLAIVLPTDEQHGWQHRPDCLGTTTGDGIARQKSQAEKDKEHSTGARTTQVTGLRKPDEAAESE